MTTEHDRMKGKTMPKNKKPFYRIRKAWARITPLRHYALMPLRPVTDVFVHHTVIEMPADYMKRVRTEQIGKTKRDRTRAARQAKSMEKKAMRQLEEVALGRGFDGISYTNIVFESGRVYLGRGFTRIGAHTADRNSSSYGIAAQGNFMTNDPSDELVNGIAKTIKKGIKQKRIRPTATIRGHRDVSATACPGDKLYRKLDDIRRKART